MRFLTLLGSIVLLFACGKSEVPDAGTADAGFDAGVVVLCLPDTEDAGPATDAGLC